MPQAPPRAARHADGMNATQAPADIIAKLIADPRLPSGPDERFALYGVMGLPFASGHVLALRDAPAASIGPAFRSVWHRDPQGAWTFFSTVQPELGCPRYWGAGSRSEVVPAIDLTWTGPQAVRVRMGDRLDWRLELGQSVTSGFLSLVGGALPDAAWRSDAVLGAMGPVVGPLMRAGKVRLQGRTPNGQHFRAAPTQIWPVTASRAVLDGADLGEPGPVDGQARLGDLWLPQQGFFFAGTARFSGLADG